MELLLLLMDCFSEEARSQIGEEALLTPWCV
jgi:hypothetical protein